MKFRQYLERLNCLAKNRPESLDLEVVFSKDDEGNGYNFVNYEPSIGHFDGERNGDFEEEKLNNAICIN